MNALPLRVSEVKTLVTDKMRHTAPVSSSELLAAINFGYRKVVRAIRAVRPAPFESYIEPFTLLAGVSEYDVGELFPPFFRPIRLAFGVESGRPAASFVYRGLQHEDSVEAEARGLTGASASVFFYDVLEGFIPAITAPTTTAGSTTSLVFAAGAYASINAGNIVRVPATGPIQTTPAGNITLDYVGRIRTVDSTIGVTLTPAMNFPTPIGTPVSIYRKKALRIVPAPAQGMTGRLWYQYVQDRLRNDTDYLEAVIAEHVDCIVAYALSTLKLPLGDADCDRWLRDADAMRAELIQDMEPGSFENTEPLGSALHGVVTY